MEAHKCGRENGPNTPKVLVGTQIDLRADSKTLANLCPITFEQGKELARQIKAKKYMECSALTGQGLEEVFVDTLCGVILIGPPSPKRREISCVLV